jgi:hypothetical protein
MYGAIIIDPAREDTIWPFFEIRADGPAGTKYSAAHRESHAWTGALGVSGWLDALYGTSD